MKNKACPQPALFVPKSPSDFIGPAHELARLMKAKVASIRDERNVNVKYVLTGQPGIGKTRLAELLACELTGETIVDGQSFNVESVNGRNVDLELVRRWQSQSRYVPLGWTVKIINELDTCKQDSQDLLLTMLDELAKRWAIIGTSNARLKDMDERFQTRLQQFHVKPPEPDHIGSLLKRFGFKSNAIGDITLGCGGNVRAALLDAQSILDAQMI